MHRVKGRQVFLIEIIFVQIFGPGWMRLAQQESVRGSSWGQFKNLIVAKFRLVKIDEPPRKIKQAGGLFNLVSEREVPPCPIIDFAEAEDSLRLAIAGDSSLVIRWMTGACRNNNTVYSKCIGQVFDVLAIVSQTTCPIKPPKDHNNYAFHIYREFNTMADKLANVACFHSKIHIEGIECKHAPLFLKFDGSYRPRENVSGAGALLYLLSSGAHKADDEPSWTGLSFAGVKLVPKSALQAELAALFLGLLLVFIFRSKASGVVVTNLSMIQEIAKDSAIEPLRVLECCIQDMKSLL